MRLRNRLPISDGILVSGLRAGNLLGVVGRTVIMVPMAVPIRLVVLSVVVRILPVAALLW